LENTIQILFWVLIFFTSVQFFYWLFVFSRTAFHSSDQTLSQQQPGVSVIVAAWDELENLKELLPILNDQQYPNFEIIVIDDRSTDGSYDYLLFDIKHLDKVRFIKIEKTPPHITAKKYALTLGIKGALNDLILVTDADCRPQSNEWIAGMVAHLTPQKDIVLGISPYYQVGGLLNSFIRFDTFYTALQYTAFAKAGLAYMGVGRNLLYRKNLFFESKGFHSHNHIIGGDDDLFMNEVATKNNVAVSFDPATFVYSMPKTDFGDWYLQKRRHLSVGKYYRFRNKAMLGLLGLSQILVWFVFIALMVCGAIAQNWYFMLWGAGVFGLRLVLQWIWFGLANPKLGNMIHWGMIPIYDFLLFIYSSILGTISTISRKKLVTWK
jgi:glycosyltransferase involved in cell wall biosynthesis